MPFAITNKVTTLPPEFTPAKRFEVADQGATTSGQDAGTTMRVWRAYVYQKAFTGGTGTVGPIYALQVADDAAFTTNVRTLDIKQVERAAEQAVILIGQAPFVGGQRFGRVKLTLSGTDAATFDASIEAAP